jgi:hypothetical protein
VGNCARRLSGDVTGENLAHDCGLFLDDFQFAGLAEHSTIAECAPAGVPSIADDALKAAPGMNGQILEEVLSDERAQSAVEFANVTVRGGVYLDAVEIERDARGVIVGLAPKKPIQILGDNDIEKSRLGGAHQGLKARTVDRTGSRNLAILKRRDDRHPMTRGVVAAECDLILDGPIFLTVGRIPSVDGSGDHGFSSIAGCDAWRAAISAS